MSNALNRAQQQAVRDLAARGVLSAEQAEQVIAHLESSRSPKVPFGSGVSEVLGYVGGALVLGGAGLLLSMSWDELSRAVRAGLLVAATVVLLVGGVGIAGGPGGVVGLRSAGSGARSRIVAVLFALGALTAAMAVSSGFDQYHPVLVSCVGSFVAAVGYLALPSVPGLLVTGGFSVGLVLNGVDEWFDSSTPAGTTALIALGLVWAWLAWSNLLVHRQVGLGGGSAIALVGGQWPLADGAPEWGYGATLLIALLCFLVFLARRDSVLLAAGVIGVTLAVPEAVWDWTGGALGGPLAVLLVGVVLLIACGLGLRLHRSTAEPIDDREQL